VLKETQTHPLTKKIAEKQGGTCFFRNCDCKKLELDHDHLLVALLEEIQRIAQVKKIQVATHQLGIGKQKRRNVTTKKVFVSKPTKREMHNSISCLLCKEHNTALSEDKSIADYLTICNFMMRKSNVHLKRKK
jgi:hypothetical protein